MVAVCRNMEYGMMVSRYSGGCCAAEYGTVCCDIAWCDTTETLSRSFHNRVGHFYTSESMSTIPSVLSSHLALQGVQAQCQESTRAPSRRGYGRLPEAPKVSHNFSALSFRVPRIHRQHLGTCAQAKWAKTG